MALGEAENIYRVTGARVLIVDQNDQPRWSPIWENHPAVARSASEPHRTRLVNGPGARPYIKAWAQADGKPMTVYSDWRARDNLGHLVLNPAEAALGRELHAKIGAYVVVEPHVQASASPNKSWGFARFQEVVNKTQGVTFVQVGDPAEKIQRLDGVTYVPTATFRDACGVLSNAAAYLGPEGGLHHAAAALRIPGVVIFGSFCHPDQTGYPGIHVNLYVGDQHSPCGRFAPCTACQQALERIKPDDVSRYVQAVLRDRTVILHRAGGCGHTH